MKKIILTSVLTLCVAVPAFAEPFPGDGSMKEDKVYDNAATYTNMGVYSGEVTAQAEYELIPGSIAAGYYLPKDTILENAQLCLPGYFCVGKSDASYDATKDQGLTSCSTLTGGFTDSDEGASEDIQCYKGCVLRDVEHASEVSGRNYYGGGIDTCAATECDAGYHLNNGVDLPDTDRTGETLTGNDFVINFAGGEKLYGTAKCSNQAGSVGDSEMFVNATAGDQCWCGANRFVDTDDNEIQITTSTLVFSGSYTDTNTCQSSCAAACADALAGTGAVKTTLFAAIPKYTTCEANVITITWQGAEPGTTVGAEYVDKNNAGACVYDGDIRTPDQAAPKKGYRFVGWKFEVANQSTND